MLLARGMVGCTVSVSSGVSHTIDFVALMHTAICWQRQAASYMHDLQVSRETFEQQRTLQPSACEHIMQHVDMSSRETCFGTRMEKGAAACCTAYFSLMHVALGIYTLSPDVM